MWSKKFRKTLEQDEPPLTPVAGVYDEGAGSSSAADGADGLTQGIVASAEAAEAAATEQLAMSGAGAATARKADVEPGKLAGVAESGSGDAVCVAASVLVLLMILAIGLVLFGARFCVGAACQG